jgi:hypothetical protein
VEIVLATTDSFVESGIKETKVEKGCKYIVETGLSSHDLLAKIGR